MNAPDALRGLYPDVEPYATGRLAVADGHELYWEECGRRDGVPVAVLHGGPGGGCSPAMRRFFDARRWRVILFDQRGCGRSRPHSSLEHNTTWDLVDDMERLRTNLGVDRWVLFGGSWGAALAVAYAQAYPDRVLAMILRGVFLIRPQELDWFYRGGAGALLPQAWERFLAPLPEGERVDPIAAYHDRLIRSSRNARLAPARAWTTWESDALDPLRTAPAARRSPEPKVADALARIECHYFHHQGFLKTPHQLLDDANRLAGIPGAIVQGGFDLVTPPRSAWELAKVWRDASLAIVDGAGHAASEPGIIDGLVRATDAFAARLS